MDVYRLDLCTKKWQLLCQARGEHPRTDGNLRREVAYYDNHLYMFGGTQVMVLLRNMFLDSFDVSSNLSAYLQDDQKLVLILRF